MPQADPAQIEAAIANDRFSGKPVSSSPEPTIGILGGGQLGRMLALAAARLGLKLSCVRARSGRPAFDVVHRVTCADYDDDAALDRFARDVDVVTYEFENVPAETAAFLARAAGRCCPTRRLLATTQDRLAEKRLRRRRCGHRAPRPSPPVDSPAELAGRSRRSAGRPISRPAASVMTARARRRSHNGTDPEAAWRQIGGQPAILEAFVPFEREVSVIAARAADGQVACFDVTENEHRDHILSVAGAGTPERRHRRGKRGGSRARSRTRSTMWASSRSRCSGRRGDGRGPPGQRDRPARA